MSRRAKITLRTGLDTGSEVLAVTQPYALGASFRAAAVKDVYQVVTAEGRRCGPDSKPADLWRHARYVDLAPGSFDGLYPACPSTPPQRPSVWHSKLLEHKPQYLLIEREPAYERLFGRDLGSRVGVRQVADCPLKGWRALGAVAIVRSSAEVAQ